MRQGDSKSQAAWWLRHPLRREYRGIEFNPGGNTPGYYNEWRGFGVAPKHGTCEKFKAFLRDLICAGEEEVYNYIWKWCAHLVQKPGEIPEVAIVLRSGQGTGKNTFADTVGKLVGRHYRTVSRMEQLTGRFNGHLQGALIVHANEALWGGNKSDAGALKALITDPYIAIEGKGRDIINIENFARVIISSNESWPVGIDSDDRRFLVLDVSAEHQQDAFYFGGIHAELENGGYEALMFELQAENIDGFSPRARPPSRFGWDIKIASADSATRWLYDTLNRGSLPTPIADGGSWPATIPNLTLYNLYTMYCKDRGEYRTLDESGFFKRLTALLAHRISTVRPSAKDGTRQRAKKLAPLDQCRRAFEQAIGSAGRIPWDGD